ncbi:MAG: DEAD/DEAH box helicase, partial [Verrucomicrobiota bacterium]
MSVSANDIIDSVVLIGSQFSEPMRVIGTPTTGDGFVLVNLVGTRTNTFRGGVTLSNQDLASIQIERKESVFQGKPRLFKLGLEAIRISLAQEYDPYFGLSISRVDPLPHQLDAVYNYLLKSARCRFLLADDAGAGKTIMAGLLLKELKLRGLVERVLIVCPANLAFQWQRELADRFQETFHILRGGDLRVQYGVNLWNDKPQIITSMDLAKREEILPSVRQADDWDLIIVDEAHRMSARDSEHKSERYRLGELLREKTAHFLLLTATPHKGDPTNFSLFLQLLDQEAYADVKSIHDAMDRREAACYLRRTKEVMLNFPKPQPDGTWKAVKLFKKRITHTVAFSLEGPEMELYQAVTHYVQRQSTRAAESGDERRARAVGFIMAMYQRRMASSTHSLKQSLIRRQKALQQLLETANQLGDLPMPDIPSEEEWDEMDDAEREARERELERATLARRKPDLEDELKEIAKLIDHAQRVEDGGFEIKLSRLKAQLTEQGIFTDPNLRLLLFTEYKDTLDYLVAKFRSWNLTVGQIHGSMKPG